MKSDEIRKKYLDFFVERKHHPAKSDGLVPSSDPTLLFTSAGMVQFKNMFLGKTRLEYTRATSCQKCFRTNDLERVGRTARHHTFFEMLGNFSFGDYFKKEAISWAWEFLTKVIKLPEDKLWVTIYEDDDETAKIWSAIVKPERIVRLGKDSNFWQMGETGPCGPCSEIIYDQGDKFGCGKEDCKVGCDCDRYLEVWNLVFTQFDRDETGKLNPLPQKNIDTGMGLERLAAVVQGVPSNFDTDLFQPIIRQAADLAGVEYGREEKTDISLKIISDHVRGVSFLIGDGILPSNDGRGYVLRRMIRRAHRYGKILGINEPFLHKLASVVIETMKGTYTELAEAKEHIYSVIMQEENKFQQTLEQGLNILDEVIAEAKTKKLRSIPGEQVFKLYDTFGFPADLTQEIVAEQGLGVDLSGFDQEMEKQKEKARAAWKGSGAEDISFYSVLHKETGDADFVGYEEEKISTKIAALLVDKKTVSTANAGETVSVVLFQTPFYGETGGQVGDTGRITKGKDILEITDTIKPVPGLIVHQGVIKSGTFNKNDTVEASIDEERRNDIARNHTATHLLQAALRTIFGAHVAQAGSLVEPERLRFDFSHNQGLDQHEREKLEDIVNGFIRANLPVKVTEKSLDEAKKSGAIALFGEKYGAKVRVVEVPGVSQELCGGTHCGATGEIGLFKILNEASIAQGVRRIEAITGRAAVGFMHQQANLLTELEALLKTNTNELLKKAAKLLEQVKTLQKEIQQQKTSGQTFNVSDLTKEFKTINGVTVLARKVDEAGPEELRLLGDKLKEIQKSGVFVLGGVKNDKIALICLVTQDLYPRGLHAGKIIKEVAAVVGGSGGGRQDMAQAGGKDINKLDEAISKTIEIIEHLK